VFERLARNLRLNRLDNVVAHDEAVGCLDGSAEFFHVPGIIPCSSSLSSAFTIGSPVVERVPVKVVRLDTFAAERGLDGIDLMKLDTETTEPDGLTGMGQLLEESRPDIICEALPTGDGDALTAILEPLDYSFYLLTDTGPRRRDHVIADERWSNYLFSRER
jgi:FkbM family methyltransferase